MLLSFHSPNLFITDHSLIGFFFGVFVFSSSCLFAPDTACEGRCLVLETEISGRLVRCPGHAAAGRGLVTRAGMVSSSALSAQTRTNGSRGSRAGPQAPTVRRSESVCDQVSGVSSQ